jgi:hypothetical protein
VPRAPHVRRAQERDPKVRPVLCPRGRPRAGRAAGRHCPGGRHRAAAAGVQPRDIFPRAPAFYAGRLGRLQAARGDSVGGRVGRRARDTSDGRWPDGARARDAAAARLHPAAPHAVGRRVAHGSGVPVKLRHRLARSADQTLDRSSDRPRGDAAGRQADADGAFVPGRHGHVRYCGGDGPRAAARGPAGPHHAPGPHVRSARLSWDSARAAGWTSARDLCRPA